jgi:hypothetical protein
MVRLAVFAALCFPACCLGAGSPEWSLARSARFEVYAEAGAENPGALLVWFERLHGFFEQQTGVKTDSRPPVRVVVFHSADEYERFRLRPSADAFYVATEARDYIVLSDRGLLDWRTAAHEYWHFVEHAGGLHLPPWLNEGLAEVFSTVHLGEHEGRMGFELRWHTRTLRTRSWIPLAELLALPADAPLRSERDSSEIYYAESWALAHMLLLSPDYSPGYRELAARLSEGTPGAPALQSVYGKSPDTIARDLRGWVEKGRYRPVAVPGISVDAPPAVFEEVSPFTVRLFMGEVLTAAGKRERAEALYRELAAEGPPNAEVFAALAIRALQKNDYGEARVEWAHALDLGIGDARSCYRFAKMAEFAGMPVEGVRPALERAVALEPGFDDALYSLALLENDGGDAEAAVRHLRAMRQIAPARRFHYWTSLSSALNDSGRHMEAKAAAEEARNWAATEEERGYASRLAVMAQTELAVRFARDAHGNTRLETTRTPRGLADFNPFIEPGDRVRRAEGRLREVVCGNAATFVVETAAGRLALTVPDPAHVEMLHAPPDFTCGPQAAADVVAVYAETAPGVGTLRGLEFR